MAKELSRWQAELARSGFFWAVVTALLLMLPLAYGVGWDKMGPAALQPYLWLWAGFYGAMAFGKLGRVLKTWQAVLLGLLAGINALLGALVVGTSAAVMGVGGMLMMLVMTLVPVVPWFMLFFAVL